MAQVPINIGTAVESGDGDTLRDAFAKVNDNTTDLSAQLNAYGVIVSNLGTAAALDVGTTAGTVADGGLLGAVSAQVSVVQAAKLDKTGPGSVVDAAPAGQTGSSRLLADWLAGVASIHAGDPLDSAFQFLIDDSRGMANRVRAVGSVAGGGPGFVPTGGSNADQDLNFAGKGKGGVWFGNGAGPIFAVQDNGLNAQNRNWFSMRAGANNAPPRLSSPHTAEYSVPFSYRHDFKAGETSLLRVYALADTPTMGVDIVAGTDFARIQAAGSATNIPAYLSTKGSGLWYLADGRGTIATLTGRTVPTSSFSFTNGDASNAPTITVSAANGSLLHAANGTGQNVVERVNFTKSIFNTGRARISPGAGATTNLTSNISGVIFTNAAAVAGQTIGFPASPLDGMEYIFSTYSTITGVVWSPGSGDAVVGFPSTLSNSAPVRAHYDLTTKTWSPT